MNYTTEQIEKFIDFSIDYTNGSIDIDDFLKLVGVEVEDTTGLGAQIDEMNLESEEIYNYELADSIMSKYNFKF